MKINQKLRKFALITSFIVGLSALSHTVHSENWSSDVIGVDVQHLNASFWLNKLEDNQPRLMSPEQIQQHNNRLFSDNKYVSDPLALADTLNEQTLLDMVNNASSVPSSARYYDDGEQLTGLDFAVYQDNMNLAQIKPVNTVRFGLVVQRSSLRRFPTHDRVFNDGMDKDLDRFQETGVFPGETAAILLVSKDNQWLLVQVYNYVAWIQTKDIAIGKRTIVQEYLHTKPFLLVTGSKIQTNYVPESASVSEVDLDMGTRLPLVDSSNVPNRLYEQNPYASHVVWLPTREPDGTLKIVKAMIARNKDVHVGYLPFTKANLITQAFKFLGERYGWGHDYNGRDCTGFIGEIYRSFGILMPRNSGDQGGSDYGIDTRFAGDPEQQLDAKLANISTMQVGDLIYIPGHVMMYIGLDDQDGKSKKPFVIHDVKGLAYFDQQGEFYRGTLNGVSVTPLLPLRASLETSYLDLIYNIKRIR